MAARMSQSVTSDCQGCSFKGIDLSRFNYYVSAVRYAGKTEPPGQTTTLTLRRPNFLRA